MTLLTRSSRLRNYSTLAGFVSLVVGILVLIGWATDNTWLKSLVPGFINMKPNTALGLILLGTALGCRSIGPRFAQRIAAGCAFAVVTMGVLTILEYLLGWNLEFDRWIFKDSLAPGSEAYPGRMGFNTASCFVLFGVALLLKREAADTNDHWREGLTLGGLFIAFIALLGHFYQAETLYGISRFTPMALHSALTLFFVGTGILFLHPDRGLMAIMTSEQAGGQMLRYLLPGGLLLLPIIGWIRLVGERQGLYNTELGLAIFATLATATLFLLLIRTAGSLNSHQQRQNESEQRFRQMAESIREVFWLSDPAKNQVLYVSPGYETIWGRSCDSLYASPKSWAEAIHPEDRARVWQAATTKQSAGTYDEEYRIVRPDGAVRWIRDRAFPVRDTLGTVVRIAGVADDITERKRVTAGLLQAHEELERRVEERTTAWQESQKRLELILNDASVATWDWNMQTGGVQYSEQWAMHRGLTFDESNPHTPLCCDGIHPEDRAHVRRVLQDCLDGRTSLYETEMRIRTAGGEWTWIMDRGRVVERDAQGKVLRMAGVEIDITARKRAEQDLRDSESRFRAIFEQAAVGVAQIDTPTGRFVRVNQRYADILGMTKEELTTTDFMTITYPDDLQADLAQMDELTAGRIHTFSMEKRLYRKDRSLVWVNLAVSPMWASGQHPTFHIAVVEDITERKRAEEALKKSEERYSSLVSQATDIIYTAGMDGRFTFVNAAACAITGYQEQELPGTHYLELIRPDFRETAQRLYKQQLLDRTSSTYFEFPVITKNGREVWFGQRVQLRFVDDRIVGVEAIARDITERKQAEEALQSAYEQLRELAHRLETAKEAERQRIARELHDEFGQALTAMKLDLSWLSSQLTRVTTSPAGVSLVKKTETLSTAVDALIDSIRETATSLRPSMLDDLGLIPALEWLVKQFRERTKIDCRLETAPEIERVQLTADSSTALFRMTQEMLTNVVRHAHASTVQLRLFESAGSLVLECTDNGDGIDVYRTRRPGSLGLRGMEERAALLGGSFTIAGMPDIGTTATVSLPLTSVRVPAMENQP